MMRSSKSSIKVPTDVAESLPTANYIRVWPLFRSNLQPPAGWPGPPNGDHLMHNNVFLSSGLNHTKSPPIDSTAMSLSPNDFLHAHIEIVC